MMLFQPIGDQAQWLAQELTPVAKRVRSVWSRWGRTLEALAATAPVQRLRCIGQLNEKRSTVDLVGTRGTSSAAVVTRPVARITRFDHSRAVSARAMTFACATDDDDHAVVTAAAAGLLHDVGHPPFSHTLEHAIRRFAPFDHEHAGIAAVRASDDIRHILAEAQIDVEDVIALIEERGGAGIRQSIADTATYLWHDALAAGFPISPTADPALLASLMRCDAQHLHVRGPGVFSHLLARRAKQYAEFYQHPYNRLLMLLIVELATAAHEARCLDLVNITSQRDEDLWKGLRAFAAEGPTWARSAMGIVAGEVTDLSDWDVQHADRAPDEEIVFASRPIDYTRKRLELVLPDGTHKILRASPTLRPVHHTQWLIARYVGAP